MGNITPATGGGSINIGPAAPKPNWAERYGISNFLNSALETSKAKYANNLLMQQQAAKDAADMARQQAMLDQYYKPSLDIDKIKADAASRTADATANANKTDTGTVTLFSKFIDDINSATTQEDLDRKMVIWGPALKSIAGLDISSVNNVIAAKSDEIDKKKKNPYIDIAKGFASKSAPLTPPGAGQGAVSLAGGLASAAALAPYWKQVAQSAAAAGVPASSVLPSLTRGSIGNIGAAGAAGWGAGRYLGNQPASNVGNAAMSIANSNPGALPYELLRLAVPQQYRPESTVKPIMNQSTQTLDEMTQRAFEAIMKSQPKGI